MLPSPPLRPESANIIWTVCFSYLTRVLRRFNADFLCAEYLEVPFASVSLVFASRHFFPITLFWVLFCFCLAFVFFPSFLSLPLLLPGSFRSESIATLGTEKPLKFQYVLVVEAHPGLPRPLRDLISRRIISHPHNCVQGASPRASVSRWWKSADGCKEVRWWWILLARGSLPSLGEQKTCGALDWSTKLGVPNSRLWVWLVFDLLDAGAVLGALGSLIHWFCFCNLETSKVTQKFCLGTNKAKDH